MRTSGCEGDENSQNKAACSSVAGHWPGDILVLLLLGETNLTRKLKINGQGLIEVAKLLGSSQEKQAQTLASDISLSLGMRRCKNLDS